ncbi:MAG TPA: transcriptional regulator [Cytophagales bacterium]|jgi:y4mF family transcriptional regulator|nr:transcriptional regulator [Cytophagales bacterium]
MDQKEIGIILKERRKSLKITQLDLADIAGVSVRSLRDIEKGKTNPELETLLNLCKVLGLEISIKVIK